MLLNSAIVLKNKHEMCGGKREGKTASEPGATSHAGCGSIEEDPTSSMLGSSGSLSERIERVARSGPGNFRQDSGDFGKLTEEDLERELDQGVQQQHTPPPTPHLRYLEV